MDSPESATHDVGQRRRRRSTNLDAAACEMLKHLVSQAKGDVFESATYDVGPQLRRILRTIYHDNPRELNNLKKDRISTALKLALVPIAKEWVTTGGCLIEVSRMCAEILDDFAKGGSYTDLYDSDVDRFISEDDDDDVDADLPKKIEPPRDGAVSRLGEPDEDDEMYYQKLRKSKPRPLSAPPGSLLGARAGNLADFQGEQQPSTSLSSRRVSSSQSIASLPRSASNTSLQNGPKLRRTDSVPSINEYVDRDRPPLTRLPTSLSHTSIARQAVPLPPVPESPSPSKSLVKAIQPLKPTLKKKTPAKPEEEAEFEEAAEEVKEDKETKETQGKKGKKSRKDSVFSGMTKKIRALRK